MKDVFTIGFTKKSAQEFFELLKKNEVELVVDVRLNNTSQLSGFSKYPDIKYFLKEICGIAYKNDVTFAPTEQILKDYKKKEISWEDYVNKFNLLMEDRKIQEYIKKEYGDSVYSKICLLCSEEKPENCHRSIVAKFLKGVLNTEIIHL